MVRLPGFVRYRLVFLRPAFWPSMAPMLGLSLGLVALSPDEATASFYGTAAQIIPVLLLVLAVELRFFRVRTADGRAIFAGLDRDAFNRAESVRAQFRMFDEYANTPQGTADFARLSRAVYGVPTLLVLMVGLFVALHPLAVGDDAAGNPRLVYAALGAGIGAIAALAIVGDPPEVGGGDDVRERGEGSQTPQK